MVYMKDNYILSGVLLAFDIHINLALDEVTMLRENQPEQKVSGRVFIRGDRINFIV